MKYTIDQLWGLRDKSIWVFGGAGYLGKEIVRSLDSLGARVLCVDLDNKAQDFVTEEGFKFVSSISLNTKEIEGIEPFVAEQVAQHGVPDGYVNLTYASTAKPLELLTPDDFDEVNHNGLTATFILTRAIALRMAEAKKGSVVLFSSMYGSISPYPEVYREPLIKNPIEYGVGKAGIEQMIRYMAVHWGREGVRFNCISPGPFPNLIVQSEQKEFVSQLAAKSPLGRVGQSNEIAGAVIFLLSSASSYVTGQDLAVDGGWSVW